MISELRSLPRPHPHPWRLEESARWVGAAENRVPGLTSSMMKRPEQFCPGRFPALLLRGAGAVVEDVDGNEYVDFICGLGANSLGHGHDGVLSAIRRALEGGILHSLPTPIEQEAADLIAQSVPCAEMVRFFKTGADATSAAIRVARATTRRERIVTVGYNGWHDHFMYDTPGVPRTVAELSRRLPLFTPDDEARTLETIEAGASELAAVILSLPYNRVVSREFLLELRRITRDTGALFVFDEIVTGFRLAPGGAQARFDVRADLCCVSKALAAGMPLSAVTGPRELLGPMRELQVSTTFGGETLALAACVAALNVYRSTDYYERLAALGRALKKGINEVSESLGAPLRILGYEAIPLFAFSPNPAMHVPLMATFQGHMAERGVLLRRDVNFLCAAHTLEQIDFTIDAARSSLTAMRAAGLFSRSQESP